MADENKKNLDEIKKANTAKKEGIELNKETKKELLSQREALNELLKLQKAGLETRRETLGLSRDLAKFAAEEVIAHEKSDKFIRSEADIAEAMLKNEQLREELKQKVIDSGGEISKNLQSQLDTTEDITAQLQEQFNKRDLINEKIGISDNILRGIEQVPFLKEFIDGEAAIAATEEAILNAGDAADKTSVGMKATLGNVFQQLKDASVDIGQAIDAWGMKKSADFGVQIFQAMMELSKQTTAVQKDLALTNEEAATMNNRLQSIAMNARNGVVNINDMRASLLNINEQLGIATQAIRDDIVEEMAILAKTTGLSAEAQGNFAKDAILSGKNAATITKEARATIEAQVKQGKLGLNVNKVLDEAGQITGVIAANFGFSIERIAKAIAVSKQLGFSLKEVQGVQAGILDFASSIENELAAELFTNKQLNLEKARLYALTNDYTNLQKEITKQFPSMIEFEKMNYFAKERYAAALGLSVDAMADIIRGNKTNRTLAEEAADAGETAMAAEYEKLAAADALAAAQEKITTSLVNMMTPLLPIIDAFASLANNATIIKTMMVGFAAVKLGQMFLGLRGILRLLMMSATAATWTSGALTLGVGLAIAIPLILGAIGSMKSATSNVPSKNNLSPMDVAEIQKGEVRAHSGESLVRTDTLEALINKAAGGNQQNMQPVVLSVNYSGFDAVKAPTHYNSSIR